MKKYLSLFKYEMKTILRDPLNLYMLVFPIILTCMAAFVFPMIFENIGQGETGMLQITMLLMLVVILVIGSFFLSAMATFLLLENKDENNLSTIAVTPIGTSGYVIFKMSYIYIMSVISSIVIVLGTKLLASDKYAIGGVSLFERIGLLEIISFSLVSGLFVISLSLLQAAFARNKIEGFAFIKGTGMVALIPAILILEAFHDGLQYLLGVFPNFWAVKGFMLELFPIQSSANLNFPMYIIIGAIYNLALLFLSYRFFMKRVQY